jgi:uncharacterized protein
MLRLIFLIIIIYFLYRLVKGMFGQKKKMPKSRRPAGFIDEMVQDPYCKTYIPRREAVKKVLGGKEILFCSEECAEKYEAQIEGKEKS